MKRKSHLITPARVLMLGLFVLATALQGQAQSVCRTVEECRKELALSDQIIEKRNTQIKDLNDQVTQLEAAKTKAKFEIEKLELQVAETEKLLELHRSNEKSFQTSLALQTQIIENREAAIKDRDTVIKELVKVAKKSSFEKFMDTLPSIAGILALAIAK